MKMLSRIEESRFKEQLDSVFAKFLLMAIESEDALFDQTIVGNNAALPHSVTIAI